jgi:hypothetical protein
MLAAAVAAAAAQAGAQPALVESWRETAGNWTGKRQALDPEGNLLVVGDTVVGDIIQVRKYSAAGDLLWSSVYDPPERVVSYWIATDPAGNAWVAAARITGSQNSRVGFLTLRYDPQGNLAFVDGAAGGLAVRVLTDAAGNAYVIGNGWSGTGVPPDHYMVVKYAPDGRRLWTGFLENGSSTFLAGPRSLALSPAQDRLVVAGGGFTSTWHALSVALFDTASGARLWNHVDTTLFGGNDVAFAPDGASVYVGNMALTPNGNAMSLHKFDLAGNRVFSRTYAQGSALLRLAVDGAGDVVATGTATPLPGNAYRDWMTIKTDPAGVLRWARRYDASRTFDEVPGWITTDEAGAVYVAGMGGPSPNTGNVSLLRPVTAKYDADGMPVWATFVGGDAHVTVDPGGSVFTLYTGQMTSVRFEQTGAADPVPSAPAGLAATGTFNGVEYAIDLSWTDAASNEFFYAVERCQGAACATFAEIGRSTGENATGFRDRPLPAGSTFTYRVRAVGFAGSSGYSNTALGTTSAVDPPAAPSALSAASSGGSVQLAWTDNSSDESQFSIERCAGAGCADFAPIGAVGGGVTTYVDSAVAGGQGYSYRVRAWASGGGYSAYSNVAAVVVPAAALTAPTNLVASSPARARIDLAWTNTATGGTTITVERCRGAACTDFTAVARIAATATSWTDLRVRARATYRYRVFVANGTGRSPYSNIAASTAR